VVPAPDSEEEGRIFFLKPEAIQVGPHTVEISRPGKILFPADGITKGELADYYRRIAPRMLPYLAGRPLVLQRFPDGIGGSGFIQKAAGPYYPEWIRKATVSKAGGTVKHVVCDDAATLVYLANQAAITLHTWLSRTGDLHRPDQMILDFDPSRDDDIAGVAAGALALKELLDGLDLPAFAKATGSRGVHVVVPLDGKEDFDTVRAFARQLAEIVVDRDSSRYTLEQHKSKRRGRVFIDVNRNAYAQTAVAVYSVRARNGAPVAVPLDWSELRARNFRPDAFTIRNLFRRLEAREDPWKDFGRHAASLHRAARKLENFHAA
jgi:bifunctional non-homologous end joining protein LigD